MKKYLPFILFPAFCLVSFFKVHGQALPVVKTNPVKVYIHYMPWFTAPENPGNGVTSFGNSSSATDTINKWGGHWSNVNGNVRHPDNLINVTNYLGATVQVRDICAHYHPLIGPYDGKDPAVVEYHLLLMKYSGIDGFMVDWYGQLGQGVPDAGQLLTTSNTLIAKSGSVGLKFGLVLEDASWKGISGATSNGAYVVNNYFTSPQYIKLGDMRGASAANATAPLVCVFGPQQFKTPGQWNTILQGNTAAFLPLFNQSGSIGADAGGEFAWPYPQAELNGGAPSAWYNNINSYYINNAPAKNVVLGAAFAGFNDFYGTNGADADGVIPRTYNGANTLSTTLSLFAQNNARVDNQNIPVLDAVQLVTWNDFSEGTMLEPTVELGFQSLDTIQSFTGVPYTQADLQQVYRLFTLRKKYITDTYRQGRLDQVFNYFATLQVSNAKILMDSIDNINTNAPNVSVSTIGIPTVNGDTGSFIISGTKITANLTVRYTIGGSAAPSGYTATPAFTDSVVLSPSLTSDTIKITGVKGPIVIANQTIILTLIPDTTFATGNPTDTLTIGDTRTPTCLGPMVINTTTAPVIDGGVDAIWTKAPANAILQTVNGTLQHDYAATWRAMYDDNYLYVLVEVKDSSLKDNAPASMPWEDDAVEIYIDGNNGKASSYSASDHQFGFVWGLDTSTANMYGTTPRTGIQYAIPSVTGGYNLEAKIPWSTINGGNPFNGKQIGFDVEINDNDYGATRQATSGWYATANNAYANPAVFGTADLTVCDGDTTLSKPLIINVDTLKGKLGVQLPVYSIIASNGPVTYSASGLPGGLSINSLTGAITGTPSVTGNFQAMITASNAAGSGTAALNIFIDTNALYNVKNIFPNPLVGNTIYIPFNNKSATTYKVRLINLIGQTVYTTVISNIEAGSELYPLQLSQKPAAGYYQLELVKENGDKTLYKIIIE